MFRATLVCLFTLTGWSSAHLVLDIPEVWGIGESVSLEQPLDANTGNWVCAGRIPDNDNVVQLQAGLTYDYNIMCGERDLNAPGCLTDDWHAGSNNNDYAGCALGINYGDYKLASDYKYLSYSRECAKRGSSTSFKIAANTQNCDKCVCSWSWAPSRDYSSPGQFYHNCFYCSVSGGLDSDDNMKQLDFINVQGAQFADVTYNDIVSENDIYKSQDIPITSTTSTKNSVSTTSTKNSVSTTSTKNSVSTTLTNSDKPQTTPKRTCKKKSV